MDDPGVTTTAHVPSDNGSAGESGAPRATILTWLRLMRLPTVFTAMSNVFCGFFLTQVVTVDELGAKSDLWLLLLSGAGLYLGGIVLNDVCDAALDAVERPERPIPSGRISRTQALTLALALMLIGLISAAAVSGPSFVVAVTLALAVVAYDTFLKKSAAGSIGMGICRFLNIMLGASAVGSWEQLLQLPQLGVAAALFTYVFGVTWFARHEAVISATRSLQLGLAIALCGIAVNGGLVWFSEFPERSATGALIALGLVAVNLTIRCGLAIGSGQPRLVQKTVGVMLLNIIFVDATMVFAATGSSALASLIVALVIPASLMKRFIPLS